MAEAIIHGITSNESSANNISTTSSHRSSSQQHQPATYIFFLLFHIANNHRWKVKNIDQGRFTIAKVKARGRPLKRHQRDTRVPSPQPPPSRPSPQKQAAMHVSTDYRFTMFKRKPGPRGNRQDNSVYIQPEQLLTEEGRRKAYIKRLKAMLADLPTSTLITITIDVHRRIRQLRQTSADTNQVSSTVNPDQF